MTENQVKATPDYIFESSWEVCNKVGGIYTVLSTRAKVLTDIYKDNIIFIGPDFWQEKENPLFLEDESLLAGWRISACREEFIHMRIGRWNIPGNPVACLVDFRPYFGEKNNIYAWAWENFQVDSLHAYGDYDEASMFSYAAGKVVESYYRYHRLDGKNVVYQAHEWMTGLGALYVQKRVPEIATIFTTHATSIGRSIAGNNKPLYSYLSAYNGDQMAEELNMQSKHSIEKQTALHADCFTTVSDITDNECRELLDRPSDQVLPNGFEDDFVPKGPLFTKKRNAARKKLLEVANALMGTALDNSTLIVATSGRYEYKNKGIDVYLEALSRLSHDGSLDRNVLAFINVPAWSGNAREDLAARLSSGERFSTPLPDPYFTHELHDFWNDNVTGFMRYAGLTNQTSSRVKVIFIPCYQNGNDGILDMPYYDLMLGNDMSIYPSYYEPWGYTPLESVAFRVPAITTDLAGFGLWANRIFSHPGEIEDGVKVIHRTDWNYDEVADAIKDTVIRFSKMDAAQVQSIRRKAGQLAQKALWKNFIRYYYKAYGIALLNRDIRLSRNK